MTSLSTLLGPAALLASAAGCGDMVKLGEDMMRAGAGDGGAGPGVGGGGGGSGGGGASCPAGDEGCPCAPDGRCDGDLACAEGVCTPGCGCLGGDTTEGGACTWEGGLLDASMQSPSAWKATGGARIDPGAEGDGNAGAGVVGPDAVCALDGIYQSFTMPDAACAVPFQLTFSTRLSCNAPTGCFSPPALGVRVNGGYSYDGLWLNARWTPTRICLGPRAHGGLTELFLGPSHVPIHCPARDEEGSSFTLEFDNIAIRPAPADECALPGEVLNGDFERGSSGWTATPARGFAEIKPGAGREGGYGGRLATTQTCQDPELTGMMSLPMPDTVPDPALRVWGRGSRGAMLRLTMDKYAIARLDGAGDERLYHVCLPRWAHGMAYRLSFKFLEDGEGSCTEEKRRDFSVDDLSFVSDARCPSGADLFDPGFENTRADARLASTWILSEADAAEGSAALLVDAAAAHRGEVSLALSTRARCGSPSFAYTFFTVPQPRGASGPALKFWYRTGALSAAVASSDPGGPLPPSPAWAQRTVCLDPLNAGRAQRIRFAIEAPSPCDVPINEEALRVDDVEATTDPACPAAPSP
ncbi:hypothetical protein [Sorangium sp. So ce131]|uniref:hypothetical protein n=1 Tax=Sorangium sp. So ce131 TaxID=3133282 RepID=UPI003F647680